MRTTLFVEYLVDDEKDESCWNKELSKHFWLRHNYVVEHDTELIKVYYVFLLFVKSSNHQFNEREVNANDGHVLFVLS